ncbi:DUF445 domain-containing protein [Clostridium weizhouense]|uniref:DUF445 family protein n=1 Tax=Clostridium weizhouense TaxID=2859781 RepID=A0ABS7AMM3_9CLOT|nr:DUF445 family protein [Clostridium weizhouense]MBW6409915.1 DUF445 family protein [Clostridium weizhouense]
MNNLSIILFLAIVGGLIGWITNILAIKLLFKPINPIKIPLINVEILGLIPKRKNDIAQNIGQVISEELLSVDDLFNDIITEEDKEHFNEYIKTKITSIISEKMNFIPGPFKGMIQGYVDDIINEELPPMITDIINEATIKAKEKINIQKIVEEKINQLDLLALEKIIISVAKNELKHIELLGLILGVFIGLIQGLIVLFIS